MTRVDKVARLSGRTSSIHPIANMALYLAFILGIVVSLGMPTPAHAQIAGEIPPPPVRQPIDENGVDVIRGEFIAAEPGVSIGNGNSALSHSVRTNNVSTTWGTITVSGTVYTVTIDGSSDGFSKTAQGYVGEEGNGATLVEAAGNFTYTSNNGTVALFSTNTGFQYPFYFGEAARLGSITFPDGTKQTFTSRAQIYCPGGYENGVCNSPLYYISRLQSVTNSSGYQLKYGYANNSTTVDDTNIDDWGKVTRVTAVNNAEQYCDPSADGNCVASGTWPQVDYAESPGTKTVTDALGQTTTYTSTATTLKIKRPGSTIDNITVTKTANKVSSVARDGVTFNYAYADAGNIRTTTVTDPAFNTRKYVANVTTFLINSFTDELNRTTAYEYDAKGRVTKVTAPEGNYTSYTYDARGNVLETRNVAKPGSGMADIVTTATYPASCTQPNICNKPITTTDAKGNVTNYQWDAAHGGPIKITAPAPSSGATRPETRYSYATKQAYYKNSGGSIVASGVNTNLLTATSTCQTSASCAGTADEVKTTIDYGPQSAGTANNLLPVSATSGSGNGTLAATGTLTYDNIGNRTTVNGPLPGSADTTRTIYDKLRRTVGVIGPDPDGAGPMKNRAQRATYNGNGQVTLAESGTTNGQSDTDWANFSSLEQITSTYDGNARKTKDVVTASGTTYAVQDYSYDNMGRPDCAAQRMNPATWGSANPACTLTTTGAAGPDRISKTLYNAASQVLVQKSALGTSAEADDVTITYNANGTSASVKDGNGNLTSYTYDGFDRLSKTEYPSPTTPGTSNGSDYEQLTYDANSNVTNIRRRNTQNIGFVFDNLNRPITKDLPAGETDVTSSYDLLGRLTQITQNQTFNYTYDALSRNLTVAGPIATTSYTYDLASRRTAMTRDGHTITYDWLVDGTLTHIRENGGAALATYAYDARGRRTSMTYGNGDVTDYEYDTASRLIELESKLTGTAADNLSTFAYNPASQITQLTKSNDAYAYQALYNKDLSDVINGLNQITERQGRSLTHDANGNLTDSGFATYSYDSENRLLSGNGSAGNASFTYDPLGRLIIQNLSQTNETRFGYDGVDRVAEYNGSNTLLRRYVHGPGSDDPILWYEGTGTSDKRYLHKDERGSITAITDASGTLININSYDEYGNPAPGNIGAFQYTGQVWLDDLGLYYYKARIYDPRLGRFLQTDPIGYDGGMNLYAYVSGDPLNGRDPMGLKEAKILPKNPHPPFSDDDDDLIIVNGLPCEACDSRLPFQGELRIKDILSQLGRGHNYDFTEVVCEPDANTICDVQKTNSEVCVLPNATSSKKIVSGSQHVLKAGPSGLAASIPVGRVRTAQTTGKLAFTNTTIFPHPFSGTVTRIFSVSETGSVLARTIGKGFAGPSLIGKARDKINEILGPGIFEAQNKLCQKHVSGQK